jgi:Lysyl oxidase
MGEVPCSKGVKACDNEEFRSCVTISECDPYAPVCKGVKNGVADERFCGTDCVLYRDSRTLPDLVPDTQESIANSIIFCRRSFGAGTCAIAEGCLGPATKDELDFGSIERILMRFDTNIVNLGADFKPPPVNRAPNLFMYSGCHGHHHFEDFAAFDLYYLDDFSHKNDVDVAVDGGKLAYCMEDSEPYLRDSLTECVGRSSCDDQGIQHGWVDRYPGDLDCQWFVLDSLYGYSEQKSGWFVYQICTNFGRAFPEQTFGNNCRAFPVYVPPSSEIPLEDELHYVDYFAQHPEICDELPQELPAGVEPASICRENGGVAGRKLNVHGRSA